MTLPKLPFNWVDLLILVVFVRILYIGRKQGFVIESLKLISVVIATYIGLHYYNILGHFFHERLFFPEIFKDIFAFVLLIVLTTLLLMLIRTGFLFLFKIEPHPILNQVGSLVLAALRAYVIYGLLASSFILFNYDYLKKSMEKSMTYILLENPSVGIYKFLHEGLVNKFSPQEINKDALRKLSGYKIISKK